MENLKRKINFQVGVTIICTCVLLGNSFIGRRAILSKVESNRIISEAKAEQTEKLMLDFMDQTAKRLDQKTR
jgi:hypothetical protein